VIIRWRNSSPLHQGTYAFNEAHKYAQDANAKKFPDYDDWGVPTKGELSVLFNNRAAIGGFNEHSLHSRS
jgi:hypothetical protein